MGKKFMGYDNASELLTAIGNKIKAKYTKPNTGIPKSDLASGVQTSLEKADSALQSYTETDPTVPSWAKQSSKPSYNSDEISDTNRTHKFATQAQLNQISTNQTNILYGLNMGVRNGVAFTLNDAIEATKQEQSSYQWHGNTFYYKSDSSHTVGFTVNDDYSITVNGSTTSAYNFMFFKVAKMSNFKNCVGAAYINNRFVTNADGLHFVLRGDGPTANVVFDDGTDVPNDLTNYSKGLTIRIDANKSFDNVRIYPLISPKTAFEADNTYKAPSLPNYDLTRLESEDRASLAEVVDSGAKNLLQYQNASWDSNLQRLKDLNPTDSSRSWSGNVCTFNGVSYTVNSDGTISTSGTVSSSEVSYFTLIDFGSGSATSVYAGKVLSGCPTGGNYSTKYSLYVVKADGNTLSADEGDSVVIGNEAAIRWVRIIARSSTNMSGKVFKPMICTKAAFDVSHKFVPYRVPITGLMSVVDKEVACSTTLTTTGIKFTATEKAAYRITATAIYYNSIPWKLAIKYKISSSSNQGTLCTVTHVDDEDVSLTVSGIRLLDVGGEFEIFAQYANSTNNRFYVLVEKIC